MMYSSRPMMLILLMAFAAVLTTGSDASIVPGKYIVEFEDSQRLTAQTEFYTSLADNGLDASPQLQFSHTLFRGVSFELHGQQDLNISVTMIASMRTVKNIWPVQIYSWPMIDSSAALNLGGTVQPRMQVRQEQVADGYAPHVMGGVDKLHAEGFTGSGIFVAIIDSGVDYNHPALGGGFGPGFKFAHGYDLVGDDFDGFNTPIPDPDPYTNCHVHGTHVSGIVGANKNPLNFTGVVPDSTLGMYRVGGCQGGPTSDVIIAAFLKAEEDGADVITTSVGGGAGWTEDAVSVAVSRIVAHGTPCSVAAGNSGGLGAFYGSSPGNGIDVLSVGSVDSITSPRLNQSLGTFEITGKSSNISSSGDFFYAPSLPNHFSVGTLPLWILRSNGSTPNDPCAPFPKATPNLSDKLVLIQNIPTCFSQVLATLAADFGVKNIFFYSDEEMVDGANIESAVNAVAQVSFEQATSWMKLLNTGHGVEVNITGANGFFSYENEVTGGYMSTYSTWSPSFDMYMKPQVSAPGRNILSTFPLNSGSYEVESGTSMATPYIGGVIALIKQVRGKLVDPKMLTSLIGNSAKPRYFNDGSSKRHPFLAPAFQQGGGLVDAYAAAHMSTILSKSSILLNDTAHFKNHDSFSILNTGNEPVTYSISHQPAGTAYSLPSGKLAPARFPPDFVDSYATVEIMPRSITILGGGSADINVNFTLPIGLDQARFPIYSGYIGINGTNNEALSLPYGGVASDLKSAAIFNTDQGYPFLGGSGGTVVEPVPAGTVFTLPNVNSSLPANETHYPQVVAVLAMGSAFVNASLVPVTENFECTLQTEKTALATVDGLPRFYLPREEFIFGQYTVNNQGKDPVPAGNYTFFIKALSIFGDESVSEDFQFACTDSFVIRYA